MSTDGLMISCIIEAMEGRDVATDDIPGAFLQTDYDKGDIHTNMEGGMANLTEEIDPDYYKDFIYIDIRKCKTCMQKPRRLYTAL